MPQKRKSRFRTRCAWLASLALLTATLTSLTVAAPSQATVNPAVSVTKLFDAIPTYSAPPSTTPWFDKTFTVSYPGAGPAYLSSDPTAYYVLNPFDRLQVYVNGSLVADEEFWEDNCTQTVSIMYTSLEISRFLKAGKNQLTLKFLNKCSKRGTDPGYFVIGPPGTHDPYDPPGTTAPPPQPPVVCGSGKFFGVRGSGEHSGYGSTILFLASDLGVQAPGLQQQAIDYPAIDIALFDPSYTSNYVNSVSAGINNLDTALKAYWAACPDKYVVLGGYSQGAEVIRNEFLRLTPKQVSKVASVVMFGDPLFNPKDTAIDRGDYANLTGIDIGYLGLGDKARKIPGSASQLFQDYCTVGDPVCNWSLANVPACLVTKWDINTALCPHNQYWDRGWVDDSVPGVVAQLKIKHVI